MKFISEKFWKLFVELNTASSHCESANEITGLGTGSAMKAAATLGTTPRPPSMRTTAGPARARPPVKKASPVQPRRRRDCGRWTHGSSPKRQGNNNKPAQLCVPRQQLLSGCFLCAAVPYVWLSVGLAISVCLVPTQISKKNVTSTHT